MGMDGDKYWVHYKYERLPTVCFLCGKMGHDDKHCHACLDRQNATPQYGDWLKVFGKSKGGNGRPRCFSNGCHSAGSDNQSGGKDQMFENTLQPSLEA